MAFYRIVAAEDLAAALQGGQVQGIVIQAADHAEALARAPEGHYVLLLPSQEEATRQNQALDSAKKSMADRKLREEREEAEAIRAAEEKAVRDAVFYEDLKEAMAKQKLSLDADPCIPPLLDGFESLEDLYASWTGAKYALEGAELLFAQYEQGDYDGSAIAVWLRNDQLYEAHRTHDSYDGLDGFTVEETSVEAILMREHADLRLRKILTRLSDARGLANMHGCPLGEAFQLLHNRSLS